MIIFFKPDPLADTPPACGGVEEIVSSPKNVNFLDCTESEKLDAEGWGCK